MLRAVCTFSVPQLVLPAPPGLSESPHPLSLGANLMLNSEVPLLAKINPFGEGVEEKKEQLQFLAVEGN